jgi:hypothetical protein
LPNRSEKSMYDGKAPDDLKTPSLNDSKDSSKYSSS